MQICIKDLNTPMAPIKAGPDASKYNYIYRSLDNESIIDHWIQDTVTSDMLNVRSAMCDGTWTSVIEHECLPDFSCCRNDIAFDKDLKIRFKNANPDERRQMLAHSINNLGSMDGCSTVPKLENEH